MCGLCVVCVGVVSGLWFVVGVWVRRGGGMGGWGGGVCVVGEAISNCAYG